MKAVALLALSGLLVACGKPPDPLAGRWDVADPESAARGSVTVGTFGDGKVTFERRGEVLGIGKVTVTSSGTYEITGTEIAMTNATTKVDASAIADPKVRAETVRILEGTAKSVEGKRQTYTLKTESPDRIVLVKDVGTLTLTRAR